MILPTKNLGPDRALLHIGAEILRLLDEPKTVSRLWDDLKKTRASQSETSLITYDWFVLCLDLLYLLGGVEMARGRVRKMVR
jgi:hypothetical protein